MIDSRRLMHPELRTGMRLSVVQLLTGFAALTFLVLNSASAAGFPEKTWPTATPAENGLDELKLASARDYALTGEGSGCLFIAANL